jgi:ABC-2 type transport system permease protein
MSLTQLIALVRTDLRLHMTNRRALIVSVLVPIFIAAFFGYLFGGNNGADDNGKLQVVIVDHDQSAVSKEIIAQLGAEKMLATQMQDEDAAHALVQSGKVQVGVVFPKGFGEDALRALFRPTEKPAIAIWFDPSQAMAPVVVQGLLAEHGMQVLTREAFTAPLTQQGLEDNLARIDRSSELSAGQKRALHDLLAAVHEAGNAVGGDAGNQAKSAFSSGLTVPYQVESTPLTSSPGVNYNSYAHSFAGMAVQFILFAGIDAGVLLLLTMERGLWQRLRAAPLSKAQLIVAKALATTLISLITLLLIYAAAMLVFGVRIRGSVPGFFAVALSFCILNACFGLLLASIGRSAGTTRGLASMATILLVMLGGAWVPAFVFPKWLQTVSLFVPTRWAVDGFDAMTWRGLGIEAALGPVGVMLGTALVCLVIAVWRMPWGRQR